MNKNIKPRYEVLNYDGQTTTSKTITREQVMAINPQSVDYFFSTAFGVWNFRTSKDEWVEHNSAAWPGLGEVCIRIIQAIQLNPGEFLSPPDIAELTGFQSLYNPNALSARLMAIRKAHKESFKNPHFFLSRRAGGYAIAWNPVCSWMWIERLPTMETKE
ncbi:hypothetical protein ACFL02_03425 [Planctomycetota bacterium]